MKYLFIFLIGIYQKINGFLVKYKIIKPSCVFYPSCSQYSKEAFKKHGLIKGFFLSLRRISRCHPWQKNNIDPV